MRRAVLSVDRKVYGEIEETDPAMLRAIISW
jgi:hypothetical protein